MFSDRVCPREDDLVVETWVVLVPVAGIWVARDPVVVETLAELALVPAILEELVRGKVAAAGPILAAFQLTLIDRKAIGLRWVICQLLVRDREQVDRARIQIDPICRTALAAGAVLTLGTTPILVHDLDQAVHLQCRVYVLMAEEFPAEQPTIS